MGLDVASAIVVGIALQTATQGAQQFCNKVLLKARFEVAKVPIVHS
jgi:hypothetical protein